MERVLSRQRTAVDRFCFPVERLIYRITFVDPNIEMTGKEYATCFVFFGLAGTLLLYGILRLQQFLPWFFPQYHTTPLSPDLAPNTAISFSTTSTWQVYAGENTMSYFSQMGGLCAQTSWLGRQALALPVGSQDNSPTRSSTFGLIFEAALLWVLQGITYISGFRIFSALEVAGDVFFRADVGQQLVELRRRAL